jgi:Zn-dependent protease with chaperone function
MRPQQHPQHGGPSRPFFLLAVALLLVLWFGSPLPDLMVEHIVAGISASDDIALGLAAVRAQRYRLLASHTVEAAGRRVLEAASVRHHQQISLYDWSFTQIDESFANAFAFPGGQIFITRGLLALVDRDELAAVLGHEIGHVLERHGQKRLVREHLGQLLLSALLHGDGDGRTESLAQEVGGLLVQQAATLATLSFSRQNEYEADAVGWYLSSGIGTVRRGAMQSFLHKLGQQASGPQQHTAWDSTHPSSFDRIAAITEMEQRRADADTGATDAGLVAPLVLGGGSSEGGATAAPQLWTAWQWLPRETQELIAAEGLAAFATGLESVWNVLMIAVSADGAVDDDGGSSNRRAWRDCDDGQSKFSETPLEDGKYVRLGCGKCLARQDLLELRRRGQLDMNPYTQERFGYAVRIDIEDVLRGVPVIYN